MDKMIENIKKMLKENESYTFLKDNPILGNKIGMLCLGGSLAYGTNLPNHGDVDIRGFYFEDKAEIIGFAPKTNQVVETNTDTVIYSFNKLVGLFLENNPNTIEMLGCKPEHYLYKSEIAEKLIENRNVFLSKRAAKSFGGYANQQLNRLENAIARDSLTQARKEEHIRLSLENALSSFEERYTEFSKGSIVLFTADSEKEDMDKEVFVNINLNKYPVRELNSIMNEFTNITRSYGKLNHRNHKKDEEHLDKHAMHLLRLYLMAFDILEKGEIITYREEESEFLRSVRQGRFRNPDGTYNSSYYDLRNEFDARLKYDEENTSLPDKPDMDKVNELVVWANEKIIRSEY